MGPPPRDDFRRQNEPKKSMQEKSQQLSMFTSEGVNVWQQLLSLFAFSGGLEKVENASQGLMFCVTFGDKTNIESPILTVVYRLYTTVKSCIHQSGAQLWDTGFLTVGYRILLWYTASSQSQSSFLFSSFERRNLIGSQLGAHG